MRIFARFAVLLAALSVLVFSVGAQPEPLRIVASFSILADVAQNVVGDTAEVTSLIPRGADPHGFEPSARDIAALESADIILIVGANFEEGLLHAIENARTRAEVVSASACVPVRMLASDDHHHDDHDDHAHDDHDHDDHDDEEPFDLEVDDLCEGYLRLLNDWDANNGGSSQRVAPNRRQEILHDADCDDAHDHDDHDDHDDDDHDHEHGLCDPHVWSDPRNVSLWTLYIRDVMSAAAPANREVYADNADGYLKALDALVRLELEPLLVAIPAENRVLLTNHETVGYFADAYGFRQPAFVLPAGSAMAEPSAQDIAALINLIRSENIGAIFSENTISPRVAEQVASETGVQNYTLYTDSLSAEDGEAATYLDYIAYNFRTIAAALTPR